MKFHEAKVVKLTIPLSISIILCCFQRTEKQHHLFSAILSLTDLLNHYEQIQPKTEKKTECTYTHIKS